MEVAVGEIADIGERPEHELPPDDEDLNEADAYVKAMFAQSLARPMLLSERPPQKKTKTGSKGRRARRVTTRG